jgi:hypothetical protein
MRLLDTFIELFIFRRLEGANLACFARLEGGVAIVVLKSDLNAANLALVAFCRSSGHLFRPFPKFISA